MPKPTEAHQRFLEEYQHDRNGREAAIRCGYAPESAAVMACKLLRDVETMPELAELRDRVAGDLGLTKDLVLAGILMEAVGKGPDTAARARIRAWELLGRHLGMFDGKGEEDVTMPEIEVEYI